ncbi:hypothetical protein NEOLEDRAFT_1091562 [Neolentinus lepideus HHB14362 ss-1]|uniref:Uncharacterized protein n=1 Tax=Neolentinus lepideus HHB14362 ss-1 TaxID=1314782 RepID=A0A165T3M5_9AGAM|nr:hypothetical protein NEOLEDRAFT_1091562 [Neolentinus lepideus HHB14362 ss-1]
MASPSHRSTTSAASASSSSLVPPPLTTTKLERRMTSPNLPPPSPLNLPEPERGPLASPKLVRPPSPLRNGFTADDSFSDDEEDNDRTWGRSTGRSHSPTPSIGKFAANFAQRVNSFVNNIGPKSPSALPTDAELEAEAERERERSRREAERIITMEAEERRIMEERVLAMMQNHTSPPPSRSQTTPNPPSPSSSNKEGGPSWWSAAKNKLTPTKELTPAQQIVKETKAKEKEEKVMEKRRKSQEWPASGQNKYTDPGFRNLIGPSTPLQPPRPLSATPSSPPIPGPLSAPPSLTASPRRNTESPSREAPPLYAQFNSQGVLDVQGTLLVIAKRFEKLERWTVGHVRALEERMSDVEKWLVDKEKEKEARDVVASTSSRGEPYVAGAQPQPTELAELRDELTEVQGRIGELGREIAKLAIAPGNLSSVSSRNSASSMARAPSASSSFAVRHMHTPSTGRGRESTSPPVPGHSSSGSRTRLPYPTGDYASPPDSTLLSQGVFSPTNSPPASLSSSTRAQPVTISGLPMSAEILTTSTSGLPRSTSPLEISSSPRAEPLPPPRIPAARTSSISPTPRKRYTVALGEPVVSRLDGDRPLTPTTPAQRMGTAYFSSSAVVDEPSTTDDEEEEEEEEEEDGFQDETIGKSSGRLSLGGKSSGLSPSPPLSNPRVRAQSTYGLSSIAAASPNTPLHQRLRSRSTDMRFGLGISLDGPKFVDPLVIRKQEKEATAKVVPPKVTAGKKVPVGELVAFFDGGEKR